MRWLILLKHPAASHHDQMKWRARMGDAFAVRLTHAENAFECVFSIRRASGLRRGPSRDCEPIPAQPAKPRFWIFPSCSIEFAVQSWALF
jgi:hypothetical protein